MRTGIYDWDKNTEDHKAIPEIGEIIEESLRKKRAENQATNPAPEEKVPTPSPQP